MNSYQNIGKYGTYLSAYGIAVKRGYQGTEQEWLRSLKGEAGERVELRYAPETDRLQWRYITGQWQDLMGLSELQTELERATLRQAAESLEKSRETEALVQALSQKTEDFADAARTAAQTADQRAAEAGRAVTAAENAGAQADLSRQMAGQAKTESEEAASAAEGFQREAKAAETAAWGQARTAESWAVGGTGTREGEDKNNARYWAEQAAGASGGGVLSFHGRSGYVLPQSGDYTAAQVGADPAGAASAVRTELQAGLREQREKLEALETDYGLAKGELAGHRLAVVSGEEGAHGLRYRDGELAFYDAGRWKPLPLGDGNVYECTGAEDDAAISGLVNGFLARTGKWADTPFGALHLTVRGQVGLSGSPQYGTGAAGDPFRCFSFECGEDTACRVMVDWAEACFPDTLNIPGNTALFYHGGSGCRVCHEGLEVSLRNTAAAAVSHELKVVSAENGADAGLRGCRLADAGIGPKLGALTVVSAGIGSRVSCRDLTTKSAGLSAMFVNAGGTLSLDAARAEGHKALYQTDGETRISGSEFWMLREGLNLTGGALCFQDSHCAATSDSYNNGALVASGGSEVLLANARLFSGYQFAVSLSGGSVFTAANTEICCEDNWVSYGITAVQSVICLNGCRVEGAIGLADLGGNELSAAGTRFTGISRGIQHLGGSAVRLTDCQCTALGAAAGEADPYYHSYEDGFGLSIENTSQTVTKLTARGCRFRGYRSGDSAGCAGYGLQLTGDPGGENNILSLSGCVFDAPALTGRVQTGAARLGSSSAVPARYAVLGCMFYTPGISVGGSDVTHSGTGGGYMPQGANFFGVTG